MAKDEEGGAGRLRGRDGYPLKTTAAALNERLGLYLSDEQQRGLATGLLVGTALAAAVLAWRIGAAVRGDRF